MSYRLIKGQLRLTYVNAAGQTRGGEPDGDSLWFEPAGGPAAFAGLPGPDGRPRTVDFNPGGCVQLRFEAIDAAIVSTGAMDTELDDVVEVSGQKVRLNHDIEDLVVRPRLSARRAMATTSCL